MYITVGRQVKIFLLANVNPTTIGEIFVHVCLSILKHFYEYDPTITFLHTTVEVVVDKKKNKQK